MQQPNDASVSTRVAAFGDDERHTMLFRWSQFTVGADNAACAVIACTIASSLLLSSRGTVLSCTPCATNAFTVNEALLQRCVVSASAWWRQLRANGAISAERRARDNYMMPMQCMREHIILRTSLNCEERWGLLDNNTCNAPVDERLTTEFGLKSLGTLIIDLRNEAAKQPVAAVLTFGASTSCLYFEPTAQKDRYNFWFIDTHRNNSQGQRTSDGQAIVMRFSTVLGITMYLQTLMGVGGGGGGADESQTLSAEETSLNYDTLQQFYAPNGFQQGERAAVPRSQFEMLLLWPK